MHNSGHIYCLKLFCGISFSVLFKTCMFTYSLRKILRLARCVQSVYCSAQIISRKMSSTLSTFQSHLMKCANNHYVCVLYLFWEVHPFFIFPRNFFRTAENNVLQKAKTTGCRTLVALFLRISFHLHLF